MNQLTFVDKIQVLFKLLFSSPIIIGIFVFSLILMILLFFYSKLNKKIIKFIFIGIYVAVISFAIIKYGSYFLSSLDSFVTIFMANIYFPTIPVYVLIMLISFIIMVVTLSSKKKNRVVKIINTVFFTFIQMLFALFIYIVESNNIDVSSNENLYTNEQTLTLLELGMGLFVVWIIVLLVLLYLKKADKIFKVKDKEEQDDFDEYINDYNEPSKNKKIEEKPSYDFNKSVVQNLVPEAGLFTVDEEEIISFDSSNDNNISPSLDATNTHLNTNNSFNSNESLTLNNNSGFNDNLNINTVFNSNVNTNTNINTSTSINNSGMIGINNRNNNTSVSQNKSISDVFNNFEFLDVPSRPVERKNNDIEIIDFDS